jgi:hypothetical protein
VRRGHTPKSDYGEGAEENRQIDQKELRRFRRRYPEVHSKVVDFITYSIEDGTLYFSVRFKDKAIFSLRYACDMFIVGADINDWKTGNYDIIREYMKPISR